MKRKSRIRKIVIPIVVILCLGGIAAYLVWGLGIFDKKEVVQETNKTYTVATGDLTNEISAGGNLALAETEDAAVDLFYPAGTKATIGEVLAEVGDTVTKGQVLATIDKNEWNDQLQTLQDAITTRERALLPAQLSVKNAEQAVESANETIATRKTAIINAEISLDNATSNLLVAIPTIDFEAAVAALYAAKAKYEYVTITWPAMGVTDAEGWEMAIDQVTEALAIAQTNYDNTLSGYNTSEIAHLKQQLQIAKDNLSAAKQAVINAQEDVPLKEMSLTISQGNLEDAEQAVQDAKDAYDEAKQFSPEVTAPIDGFITQVNVSPGDEVLNSTIVMQIANADKFMVEIAVSEDDISDIAVDGKAYVTVDSLSVTLPATVTYIAPTATIQSGVVNYSVRVELQDFTAMQRSITSGNNTNMPAFSSSDNMTPTAGFTGQMPAMTMKTIKLKQGMTVTVDLVIAEAKNVLLVPYAAVKTEGMTKYVEVVKDDGTTEKRTVTTGITDYSNIVITEGLTAGEKIVYTGAVAAITTNTNPFGGGMIFPGMGGGPGR
jgi:multidrug efflux pump subunit AcrA (membrane-fusion protein)